MPNQMPLDVVMNIFDYIEKHPSHGLVHIADELRPRQPLPHPSDGVIITKV